MFLKGRLVVFRVGSLNMADKVRGSMTMHEIVGTPMWELGTPHEEFAQWCEWGQTRVEYTDDYVEWGKDCCHPYGDEEKDQ
jgi:hypothetical protein